MGQCIVGELISVSGDIGNLELSVFRLIIIFAETAVIFISVEYMRLMYDKVGDDSFKL